MDIKVNPYKPVFTGTPIVIKGEDNREVKYLYNIVRDTISHPDYKTGATFKLGPSDEIEISSPPKGLKEYLKSIGIKFREVIKKKEG